MNSFETDPYGSWPQNGYWETAMFSLEADCNNKTPPNQSPERPEEERQVSVKEMRKRGRWRKSSGKEKQDKEMSRNGCTRKEC
eukprot:4233002-Karenia_brevis.AAC.1